MALYDPKAHGWRHNDNEHDVLIADAATDFHGRAILARIGNFILMEGDESEPWNVVLYHYEEREDASSTWFTYVGEARAADITLLGAHAAIHGEKA